ncbi:general amidase [Naematelia encephala]|uniref:amidase n=1 Tax=Naematelia encephala TaxID=71784 RepID=A0A1Y2BB08_9TREE|nr:general amidase [Naematelia encephala]
MTISWQDTAKAYVDARDSCIPAELQLSKLPASTILDVRDIPQTCGQLSSLDLEITGSESIESLLATLREGTWSAVDVITAFIKRAVIAHQLTNCLTEVFFDKALERAKYLDEYRSRTGQTVGPLHGLPISLKDQVEVEGVNQSMCYVGFTGRKATYNSVLVEILLKQGAVLYCKTNMSQGLWFGEGYNNLFGRTSNPFNRNLTCGGSSGGEGALIGLRGSLLGVGSDLGGSIRLPASFQGLYSLRGCYSRIPYCRTSNSSEGQESVRSVLGPLSVSLDGVKIFARAVYDGKPWTLDPWSPKLPWNEAEYHLAEHGGEGGQLCFAFMEDDGVVRPVKPVRRAMDITKEALIRAGHKVIDWKPFKTAEGFALLRGIYNADGGRDLETQLALSGEPRLGYLLTAGARELTTYELYRLQDRRSSYIKEALDHWNATVAETGTGRPVDGIICPVSAGPPGRHNSPRYIYYTGWCNLADYAACTFPVTSVDPSVDTRDEPRDFRNNEEKHLFEEYDPEFFEGAPVGLQVVGKKYEEEAVIRMTEIVDAAVKSFSKN